MSDISRRPRPLRCVVVWLGVGASLAGLARLAVPPLTAGLAPDALAAAGFADLLVTGCAVAALAAASWIWLLTTQVLVAALTRRPAVRPGGRVGPLRSLVLTACGVAVLAGTAPATAATPLPGIVAVSGFERPVTADPRVLDGLPMPDRTVGSATGANTRTDTAIVERQRVVVRPGDSLWLIAETRLGPTASVADIAAYWPQIYDLNRAVIGPDPDLIYPGQSLRLPPL